MINNKRENSIAGYLYALDGLRAVSLILIFIFHNWQASWITYKILLPSGKYLFDFEIFQRYGYIAIDSFFVLSGFGLFYPVARAMFGEGRAVSWREFYIKRIKRIIPGYYLMLVLLLIFPKLSYNIYDAKSISETFAHFFTHATFTHIYNDITSGSVISTAWTLGIEVAFYLVFPFFAQPFAKRPLITFVIMFIIGQGARIFGAGCLDLTQQSITSFPLLYIDIFGWGMLSAYAVVLVRNKLKHIDKLKPFMTLISVLSLVVVYFFIKWMSQIDFKNYDTDASAAFRMIYRFIVDGAFAVFLFSTPFAYDFWHKKIWGNRFFVFLSTISYSFYLWHQNIHIFLKKINVPYTVQSPPMHDRVAMDGFVVLSVLLSLAVACISTYCIELPIMRYGFLGAFEHGINKLGKKLSRLRK